MDKVTRINLLDLVNELGQDKCERFLATYQCPLNTDVENFLQRQAINFALSQTAATHLAIYDDDERLHILGYFAIANKPIFLDPQKFSRTKRDKLKKFYEQDDQTSRHLMAMPLIAQFGKNFDPNLPMKITGTQLMDMALEHVQFLEYQGSGKTVFLECSDKPALINFYTKFDFIEFGRRPSKTHQDEVLVQMIKYFDKPTPKQMQRWSQS